jgi:hypothetical protein
VNESEITTIRSCKFNQKCYQEGRARIPRHQREHLLYRSELETAESVSFHSLWGSLQNRNPLIIWHKQVQFMDFTKYISWQSFVCIMLRSESHKQIEYLFIFWRFHIDESTTTCHQKMTFLNGLQLCPSVGGTYWNSSTYGYIHL